MCARLLACPLCSQPGFLTLDALRAGLISVATRPLPCPICNEILLGIDKLTIHLFSHKDTQRKIAVEDSKKSEKIIEVISSESGIQAIMRNDHIMHIPSWSLMTATQTSFETMSKRRTDKLDRESTSGIYIPIDKNETFRNLTAFENEASNVVHVVSEQNVQTQPQIVSTNLISQPDLMCHKASNEVHTSIFTNEIVDKTGRESYTQTPWLSITNSESPPASNYLSSNTDRPTDLVNNSKIIDLPLSNKSDSFDCSKIKISPELPFKPLIKSMKILSSKDMTEHCHICGFQFSDRNILILHNQLVHMAKEKDSNTSCKELIKNYPCHLCLKVFKMKGSLMVHMRVAHPGYNSFTNINESTGKTEQISKTFKETETLSNNEHENSHSCPTCGKKFKREQHVAQHMKIHEGKQWECDICSKMFTTKYFLKKHKRLHSGEMPYKCTICDKTFTFQQSYHKHKLYHKDDKPHTCTTCGRSFKELSTLHNHERIHTGEKPFACETCGKCFRQRVSYLVHRRIHTGVMPYKCTKCGKSFRYKVSQRTHKCQQQLYDTNLQQLENYIDELQKTSTLQETQELLFQNDQCIDTQITLEENQYVLVLNDDGQPVVKKIVDVENINQQTNVNKITDESNTLNCNESNEFIQNIWNRKRPNEIECKYNNFKMNKIVPDLWNKISNDKSFSQISINRIRDELNVKERNDVFTKQLWNQTCVNDNSFKNPDIKKDSNNGSDFFSTVVSVTDSELSSPAVQMKQLRLSSPVSNQENICKDTDCFHSMHNKMNTVQVDYNNVEEIIEQKNENLSSLQTFNEDSLKELLNRIIDK